MKKFIALVLALTLALTLTACGSTSTAGDTTQDAAQDTAQDTAAQESAEDTTITVAASATPHAEILEQVKPILEEQGYQLEVKVFSDYVQPNEVVESGEFDANYFQHINYLNEFNESRGTHLVNAGSIHYEPLGIYPGAKSDLTELAKGDTIAVPNDPTNEARALALLEANGIITLAEGAGLTATVNDIVENPNELEIVEIEAAQIPRMASEVSFVVLNGNYALEAGYTSADAVALEDAQSESIKENFVNIIAVKEGNENLPKIQALVEALKSETIQNYINETYNGSVVPFV